MPDGVDLLRDKRGDQQVTFADVCDHMEDFVRRSPEHFGTVDRFARFLANVEDIDHQHRQGDDATLDARTARDVPA